MENFKVFSIDVFDKDVIFLNTIEDLYFLKDEIFESLSKNMVIILKLLSITLLLMAFLLIGFPF